MELFSFKYIEDCRPQKYIFWSILLVVDKRDWTNELPINLLLLADDYFLFCGS